MNYRYPDALVQIFSKAPVPGQAKTRLIPQLGEQGAAALSARMIRHAVTMAAESRLCPVQLWCAPDCGHDLFQELRDACKVELKVQQGADLGERMAGALADGLAVSRRVVLMGSDCPAIDAACIERALQFLTGVDCVLGPAEDGGYVLVGQSVLNTGMFAHIDWGSAAVLAQTRQRLRTAGCRWRELARLRDIDRPEDLGLARELLA